MAVATYEDVAVALGRPISTEAEQAQVEWWLSGVELFIVARLGPVAELDQDAVRYVEVEAVVAKINRAGREESSITVAVDDGNVTRRYENAVTAGDITDEWWNLLDPDTGTGLFSVRPSFEADDVRWPVSTPPAYDPYWDTFR
jgi:hypothetical protein